MGAAAPSSGMTVTVVRPRWRAPPSLVVPGRLGWRVESVGGGCWRCRARLEALPHLVELVSHLTMRLAVDAGGSLTRGRLHKTEDLPVLLVDPVAQVPDAMPPWIAKSATCALATSSSETPPSIVCTSMNRAIPAFLSRLSTSPISPLSPTLPELVVGGTRCCSLGPGVPRRRAELHRRCRRRWARVGGRDGQPPYQSNCDQQRQGAPDQHMTTPTVPHPTRSRVLPGLGIQGRAGSPGPLGS